MKPWTIIKFAIGGIFAIFLLMLFFGSFYIVNQNEVAAVTRFGSLISAQPEGPGFHLKLPFADTAHHIRTSQERFTIEKIKVKTKDNQFVEIDINLTYKTGSPFKVLFQVGEIGPSGVEDKVRPFVQSRAFDVFGGVSALEITNEKKTLETDILNAVAPQASDLFGEQIEDVQITRINYSDLFEKGIEAMVQTRNQQVAAQNTLAVKETEAQQVVAVAKGNADAAAANADGAKRVAIANAEGSAQQVKLGADAAAYARKVQSEAEANAIKVIGDAQANLLKINVAAAGNTTGYVDILKAQASQKWTGDVPKITIGGTNGSGQPVVVLPSDVLEKATK